MPIDIQSSYIMMPVDIQAQYVTLKIDIVASAVTLNVAVTGTADIQITAQTVGVYLQPEWAARENLDKSIRAYDTNKPFEGSASTSYVVPAGKTLYIVSVSFIQHVNAAVDYDHHLWGEVHLIDMTTGATLYKVAGHGGGNLILPTPAIIPGEHEFQLYIINSSNVNCYLDGVTLGYEM